MSIAQTPCNEGCASVKFHSLTVAGQKYGRSRLIIHSYHHSYYSRNLSNTLYPCTSYSLLSATSTPHRTQFPLHPTNQNPMCPSSLLPSTSHTFRMAKPLRTLAIHSTTNFLHKVNSTSHIIFIHYFRPDRSANTPQRESPSLILQVNLPYNHFSNAKKKTEVI